jgi:Fe-S cluster biogenesis protein NfuA
MGNPCWQLSAFTFSHLDAYKVRVEEIIGSRIRPALKFDGGDVTTKSLEDGIVEWVLTAQYQGCPHRQEIRRYGSLETLREEIPEIRNVREYNNQ